MAFQPIDITPISSYAAIRTTSFTTTVTASSHQRTFTNNLFPSPYITRPEQYTTLPPPAIPASTYYPSSLLILIVGEAVAIIENTNGTPISTGTFLQTPSATAIPTAQLLMNPECSSWSCWAPSERIGTSIAISFFIVGVLGLLWWGFCRKTGPEMSTRDLESGRGESRQSHGGPRQSSRSGSPTILSYTSSASSSEPSRQPQYQSYVRTRSRSRSRDEQQRKSSQSGRARIQPRPQPPLHIRDFALPAAAGLAAAAALGGGSRKRGLSTTALPRSSFHDDNMSKSRKSNDDSRDGINNRPRRSTNVDHPRARSHSPPHNERSKSKSNHFGISEKWMALLPSVLGVLCRWSEPNDGRDQVRGKGKGKVIQQPIEDSGHELFEPRHQERSRSHRQSYRESPRRANSVDAAYAQLRPLNLGTTSQETLRALLNSQHPSRAMRDRQPKMIYLPDLNLSATAEAGRKRSPSPLLTRPVGISERRRITRREARRKRGRIGNSGVVTLDTEASTAADQRQTLEEGDRGRLGQLAPAFGQRGYPTFPFPLPSRSALEGAMTAPPILAAQQSGIEQGQTPL